MFKRLFVLFLLAIATVSVSTPAHASDIYCQVYESASSWYYLCHAPEGYPSYTWGIQRGSNSPQYFTTSQSYWGDRCNPGTYYTVTVSVGSTTYDPTSFRCYVEW